MPRLGLTEILIIAAIILVLFGARRIPDLMRGLGEGIRGFKESLRGENKPEEKPKV